MEVVQVIGENVQVVGERVVFWWEKLYKGVRRAESERLCFGSTDGSRGKGMVFV